MTDKALFAYVTRVSAKGWKTPLHGDPVVEVLAGSVAKGDEVELVRLDGTVTRTCVEKGLTLTSTGIALGIRLEGVRIGDIEAGDLIRAPGEDPLRVFESAGDEAGAARQLVEAVHRTRSAGLANTRLNSVRTFPEEAAQALPDEAIALVLQKRVRMALESRKHVISMSAGLQSVAEDYDALGLETEGDRLRLAAAAALEGHRVVLGKALASAVATGALAGSEAATRAAPGLVPFALGIEQGDAFGRGWEQGLSYQGATIRQELQNSGRAVAVGWCKKCGDVVRLDGGLRCVHHHKEVLDPIVVVPSDLPDAEANLREKHS
ncbi:MAG: hypothetical protein ACXVRS_05580 [Gaiellaceae bacterium]